MFLLGWWFVQRVLHSKRHFGLRVMLCPLEGWTTLDAFRAMRRSGMKPPLRSMSGKHVLRFGFDENVCEFGMLSVEGMS